MSELNQKRNKSLISVVTVCYNSVREIEKTIQSVLNQTYGNIEYIIIDGGSTDGTVDIIKRYSDRLAYWISEPDDGIYYAMNKGIGVATGEWIHFRNSGDFFFQEETLQKMFSEPVNEDVVILYGDCRFITAKEIEDCVPSIFTESFKDKMPVFHPSTFVRTTYHKINQFNTKYRSSADYEFVYRAFLRGVKCEYRPVLVSIYDAREGYSISNWVKARGEIFDWKHSNMPFKCFFKYIYVRYQVARRNLARVSNRYRNK